MTRKCIDLLTNSMLSNDTLVCCGLDPDLIKMPHEITNQQMTDEIKVINFLTNVVDITAGHVCAYKIQKAFFDILSDGHTLLKTLIKYIQANQPNIAIFLDCKIGDIDNTMEIYLKNVFQELKADGVVVNPYMGDDVILLLPL